MRYILNIIIDGLKVLGWKKIYFVKYMNEKVKFKKKIIVKGIRGY